MPKETKSTSLRIWIAGIASVAVLAIASSIFLTSTMSSEEIVSEDMSSEEIVSEDSESPIASEVTTETPSATSEPTDSVEDSDSLIEDSDSLIIEWKEGMTWLDLLTEEERDYLLGLGTPSESQNTDNTGKQSSGKSTPSKTKRQPQKGDDILGGDPGDQWWENSASNEPPSGQVWCPEEPSENPDLYRACWEGFIAPDFVSTGMHSCFAGIFSDDDFGGQFAGEPFIQVVVRIEIAGGNYRDHSMTGYKNWDGWNKGYVLQSKTWVLEPKDYEFLESLSHSWYEEVTFYPMRDSYNGDVLVGSRKVGKWVYIPILTSDLPGSCWPPNL